MKIKLIAVDLDGTLLTSKKKVSDRTLNVLKQARKKGIYVVPLSGRPLPGVLKVFEPFRLDPEDNFAICYNGGLVQRMDGEVLSASPLSDDNVKHLLALKQRGVFGPYFMDTKDFYVAPGASTFGVGITAKARNMGVKRMEAGQHYEFIKGEYVSLPGRMKKFRASFSPETEREFEISASGGQCLEFNTPGTSKGKALTALLDLLNIQPEEAMVFGDNNNDLSDFRLPGVFKVAMGNAISEIKELADYVTASNNKDGIALAVEKFVDMGD
ncbi:haloacid dehalogenase [Lactobacillus nasalidis]|uniref:Haloacid dehalogenase n=1 Tax=Lactobacillus nasalidis TaxID=2797258 RepID=A0ABQ3W644_9LACO|nr:Cof-type HAD-IIB family hydrolase [Lactobacillus nasalidis]GHV97792.1 haloacid dehalogenase [Lactobacillus nasalidis]GHV99780.1 haloacid dehalogenase [Lactobacillus nasalidis]GHW01513.1 haloacid dehalogenase [Lactobacillus nasalidis]